jgi:hypothetical protein
VDRLSYKDKLKKKGADYINLSSKIYILIKSINKESKNRMRMDNETLKQKEDELKLVINKQIRLKKSIKRHLQ